MRALPCVIVVLLLSCSLSLAQSSPAPVQPRQVEFVQMQAAIPEPPTAFRGDGAWHLCYEIHLTNVSPSVWSLQDIQVSNENGVRLSEVAGNALATVLYHPGSMPEAQPLPLNNIGPGEAVVAYMWIDLAQNAPMPKQLQHELTVRKAGDANNVAVQSISTTVLTELPQIAAPLHGKNWVAGSAPSNTSPHRRTIIIYEGKPYIAQRYAIDWVQFGDNHETYRGDAKDNRSYYCFGHEAYAVADATVVEVKDGLPENTPGEKPAVPINFDTVAGNHVNLDLGGGVHAMYAHLQPGSIRVKVGDHVTPGQVIGLVGNTGNSSEPHLHFQLMSAKSPLGGEGLPYTFATFYQVGRMTKQPPDAVLERTPPIAHHGEMPMENAIVNFEQ
jgi:Peptidase family M23